MKEISSLREKNSGKIASLESEIRNPILIAYADMVACDGLIAGLFGSSDTHPPTILLKGWTDSQTVYLEKVYIEGQVGDEGTIESLIINQVPILYRKGQRVFFSHLAELREGENSIVIEARDEAGNLESKRISIIRRTPKALQLAERLSLSVNPFEQKGMLSEASLAFQDNLIDAIVDQNRFRVVERDKLDSILREQKLSRSNLIDRSTALKMGRLLAAQSIVTGSIIETRTGIEIVARMIDTETSEIVATEDVYDEAKDLPALRSLAEGMAIKFHREFPLLSGLVIQRRGKQIFTDLGQGEVKLQRRLIVYREEPLKHPVTGKVLGADNVIIGRARINQVMLETSRAELFGGKVETVNRLDKVITE
jgi:TolB-like protein